ncbi:single-stranded DNA-binding protein, mitochondrial [Culicoides brevitarsis]|uniref:single-stranded DNA-binding protein, mitochondrial n=1 Tax=Culicoides brevitarsis TaxID=469753 RepID=UPI00307C3B3C
MMTSKVTKISALMNLGRSLVRTCSSDAPARMEKSINTVTLLGRVGAEPQKRGNNEHPAVVFSLATHDNYRYENGDWGQRTDWHRVVVFKPALRDNVLQYMQKGQRAVVQGRISYGEFTDAEGQKKPATSIIADDVIFLK